MRRWHAERELMLRRWRQEIADHEDYPYCALAPIPPSQCDMKCHCYLGPGFMRKNRPYGCGRARCMLCHYDKLCVPRRAQEKRAWQREVWD